MKLGSKFIIKQAAKLVPKDLFLEQLEAEWGRILGGKDFDVLEETEKAWERIVATKESKAAFDTVGITKEGLKQVLEKIRLKE